MITLNCASYEQVVVPLLVIDQLQIGDNTHLAAPGWDVYELQRQWRSWLDMSGAEPPRSADAAFLGFCKKWFARRVGRWSHRGSLK